MDLKKKHYKVIILIIESSGGVNSYDQFAGLWRKYMHSFPEYVKSFFLVSYPNLGGGVEIKVGGEFGDIIYHKSEESLVPGILLKTLAGMHYCVFDSDFTFDYLLRTNLSTFVHIPNLLRILTNCPVQNYYGAFYEVGCVLDKEHNIFNNMEVFNDYNSRWTRFFDVYRQYFGKEPPEQYFFMHGTSMVFSSDIVRNFAILFFHQSDFEEKRKLLESIPDDVALSYMNDSFLLENPYVVNYMEVYHHVDRLLSRDFIMDPSSRILNCVFVRNKTDHIFGGSRKIDVLNYSLLVDLFYS